MDIQIVKKVDITVTEQDLVDMLTAKIKAADPSITVNSINFERKLKPEPHISIDIDADFGSKALVVDDVCVHTTVITGKKTEAVVEETIEEVVVEELTETEVEVPNQPSEDTGDALKASTFIDTIADDVAETAATNTVEDIFKGK